MTLDISHFQTLEQLVAILVVIEAFHVGYDLFDLLYRVILRRLL